MLQCSGTDVLLSLLPNEQRVSSAIYAFESRLTPGSKASLDSLSESFLNPKKYFSLKSRCAGTCSPSFLFSVSFATGSNSGGG